MELWQRRHKLGQQMLSRRRIYLDLRFWNDLCDVVLGENDHPDAQSCLQALRAGVAAESIVCPVEFNVVAELYKQTLPQKRAATLKLIDELSTRTVMANARERMFLESLRLIQGIVAQKPPTEPPLGEVWTRPLYMTGHAMPTMPAPKGLPPDILAQLSHDFDAHLWEMGFADWVAFVGDMPSDLDNSPSTAAMLNAAKEDPANLFKSYEATYWSEVRGALDAYSDILGEVNLYLFKQAGGDTRTVTTEQIAGSARELRRLLYVGARKLGLKATMPSLHVGVALYSRLQWDRKRPYKPNDVFDFAHAEAAVPYCDAFATEKSLGATLRSTGLAKEYSCDILTDLSAISHWALG